MECPKPRHGQNPPQWLPWFCTLTAALSLCAFVPRIAWGSGITAPPKRPSIVAGVIRDARDAASQLLAQAQASGSILAATLGNELNLASQNAILALSGRLNTDEAQLTEKERPIVQNLRELTDQARAARKDVFALERALSLDIRSQTQFLPIVGETFYISEIDSIAQFRHEPAADYALTVYGVGLGPASERSQSTIQISVGGQLVEDARVEQTTANRATVFIPANRLDSRFRHDSISLVPVGLIITRRVKRPFHRWSVKRYTVPFMLELVPDVVAHVAVHAEIAQEGWSSVKGTLRDVKTSVNMDCNSTPNSCSHPASAPVPLKVDVPGFHSGPRVIGDRKFVAARDGCIPNDNNSSPCRFCTRDFGPTPVFKNDSTSLEQQASCISLPAQWTLEGDYVEWEKQGSVSRDTTAEVRVGANLVIDEPPATDFMTVKGSTIWGDKIDISIPITNPTPGQSTSLLHFVSVSTLNDKIRVVYEVERIR